MTLVELTAKGANKGGMVQRLAQLLDVKRENVLCVGDHANDISMLTWAGEGYAPANAIPLVLNTPGVHHLPDCRDDAIAALVAELDKRLLNSGSKPRRGLLFLLPETPPPRILSLRGVPQGHLLRGAQRRGNPFPARHRRADGTSRTPSPTERCTAPVCGAPRKNFSSKTTDFAPLRGVFGVFPGKRALFTILSLTWSAFQGIILFVCNYL